MAVNAAIAVVVTLVLMPGLRSGRGNDRADPADRADRAVALEQPHLTTGGETT
jgi:hypothetical protein